MPPIVIRPQLIGTNYFFMVNITHVQRIGGLCSYFVDVKNIVFEERFVQEMSETVTRELNTLTKSLANVQMQGDFLAPIL